MKVVEPNKIIEKILKKVDKNDCFIAIIVFILGLINNFNFIAGNGIAPDSVSSSYFNIAGKWEISLGRFLIRYVNMMRYGLVSKTIIICISLVCIIVALMLLRRMFKIENKITLFLLSFIICVAPQFTETYMFIYCADAYLIAFLFSVLTVYFLNKTQERKLYFALAIITTIIVCSLYQAYLGVIIGLVIILLIYHLFTVKNIHIVFLKKALLYFLTILGGVVLYYIVLKLLIHFLGMNLASYKGADALGINTILSLPKSIFQCYKDFYRFFFTDGIINNTWYKRKYIYAILCIFTLIGTIKMLVKQKKGKLFMTLMSLVLIALFPICINIMNIIAAGTFINLVTGPGLLITCLFPILIINCNIEDNILNLSKWCLTIGIFILSWTFLLENTFTYIARNQTFENYQTVANDIYTKTTMLDNYSKDKKWMFSDIIRYKVRDLDKTNGFISNDNLTWNNYNGTLQNIKYFEKYLGVKIEMVDKTKYDVIKNTEEFKSMPIYPEPGSIKIINDVIVIKTSNIVY